MSTTIAAYGLKTGSLKNLVSEAELARVRQEGKQEGWQEGSIATEKNILQRMADLGLLKKENLAALFKGKDYIPEIKFPTR